MDEFAKIVALRTIGPGKTRVYFVSGEARDIEWKAYAGLGPVFTAFADPHYSTSCVIVEDGSGLEWPGDVDWSADAVKQAGVAVSIPVDERQSA